LQGEVGRILVFHRSERLFLRPAFPEDGEAILASIGDAGIVRNLASAPWPYGITDARSFAAMPQDQRLPHFLVTLPGTGIIGSAGLCAHEGQAEIGYWIARPHWGQGYAPEAARAVIDIARTIGHSSLVASHFLDNPASGRVLEKLGFRAAGAHGQRYSAGRGVTALVQEYVLNIEPIAAVSENISETFTAISSDLVADMKPRPLPQIAA